MTQNTPPGHFSVTRLGVQMVWRNQDKIWEILIQLREYVTTHLGNLTSKKDPKGFGTFRV